MPESRIDISELKNEGGDIVEDLSKFLKEKTGANIETESTELVMKTESEKAISRTHLRVLLRKFLHQKELKEYYRVIGAKENRLMIKERRIAEEEE